MSESIKPEVDPAALEEIARTEAQATGPQAQMEPTDTAEHVPVDKPMTKEEVEALEEAVKKVMEDKWVSGACSVMLAARRIYMATLVDLDNRLKEMKKLKDRDGVRTIITDNLANFARKTPYTRQDVTKAVQNVVLPWLMATQQAEDEIARVEAAVAEKEAEERLQGVDIPIGFAHTFDDTTGFVNSVTRQKTLVLMGHTGAVKLLLGLAKVAALKVKETQNAPKMRVMHLSSFDPGYRNVSRRANRDRLEVTLGPDQWQGKFGNTKACGRFMSTWVRMLKKGRVDLLIIDDLSKLMPERKGRDPQEAAAFAQKFMRSWCNKAGCALLAGLPTGDAHDQPELSKGGSTLEIYSHLRRITVKEGARDTDYECDTYDLLLSSGVMPVKLVDRKVIDSYGATTNGEDTQPNYLRILAEAQGPGDGGERTASETPGESQEAGEHPEVVGRSGEAGGGEDGPGGEPGVDEAAGGG